MNSSKCPECKDTGEILLFSSRVPCECLISGALTDLGDRLRTTHTWGRRVQQGVIIGRGCLDISFTRGNFYTDGKGVFTDPAEIYYEVSHLSQEGVQTPIPGPRQRVPENPSVGEYYPSLIVSPKAVPGTYQIKWSYRESVNSPERRVVQSFVVEGTP